jgi:hypothetical protein
MLGSMMMGLLVIGMAGFVTGRQQRNDSRHQMSWPLWGIIGGLILYNYFALGFPGSNLMMGLGGWAGLLTTLIGGVFGLSLYWWRHPRL